jgi:hypothetical protein
VKETGRLLTKALTKLATLDAVRERTDGDPVELWLTGEGRVVIRAYNECGNAYTEVDLFDLLGAARGWERDRVGASIAPL